MRSRTCGRSRSRSASGRPERSKTRSRTMDTACTDARHHHLKNGWTTMDRCVTICICNNMTITIYTLYIFLYVCVCDYMIAGWWFQPLWKVLVSWDDYSQYMEKNVPNHCVYSDMSWDTVWTSQKNEEELAIQAGFFKYTNIHIHTHTSTLT